MDPYRLQADNMALLAVIRQTNHRIMENVKWFVYIKRGRRKKRNIAANLEDLQPTDVSRGESPLPYIIVYQ